MRLRGPFICSVFFFGISTFIQAQVGINTTEPRTTLEVAGDMHVNGEVLVETIEEVIEDEEVTFLIQNEGNFVKEINATDDGLAIAYFQEYILSNMEDGDGDWVENFNTNIPSSEYVVTVISAYYNQPLMMWGDKADNFANPYVSAFIEGGTWRIVADYPDALNITNTQPGEWRVNTLILSRSFSKILPAQTFNLSGNSSGSATTPVID